VRRLRRRRREGPSALGAPGGRAATWAAAACSRCDHHLLSLFGRRGLWSCQLVAVVVMSEGQLRRRGWPTLMRVKFFAPARGRAERTSGSPRRKVWNFIATSDWRPSYSAAAAATPLETFHSANPRYALIPPACPPAGRPQRGARLLNPIRPKSDSRQAHLVGPSRECTQRNDT
jgi:hypothetical protein